MMKGDSVSCLWVCLYVCLFGILATCFMNHWTDLIKYIRKLQLINYSVSQKSQYALSIWSIMTAFEMTVMFWT